MQSGNFGRGMTALWRCVINCVTIFPFICSQIVVVKVIAVKLLKNFHFHSTYKVNFLLLNYILQKNVSYKVYVSFGFVSILAVQ